MNVATIAPLPAAALMRADAMRVLVLLRPTMATLAPSAASASAAANPMPLVAPVIRICLSFTATQSEALAKRKFRDECLSLEWFRSRPEAKVIIETWRQHYNEVRPHSSPGYLTPNECVARGARRDAALHGACAPGPLRNRPLGDKCRKPSQANAGPKNQGRSDARPPPSDSKS